MAVAGRGSAGCGEGVRETYQGVEEEAVVESMAGVFEQDGSVSGSRGVEHELGNRLAFVLDVWVRSGGVVWGEGGGLPRHSWLRRSRRPCWYSTATMRRVRGDIKFPRPSSILYGSSLRVCIRRRGGHVFEVTRTVERDEEARRRPAVFMIKEREIF